ncbi:olfactory receptor 5AS1 [Camelus dromedarius]|uniref:Olfactory receptor n=3 Tax=Camelus TaxID=9836 RepID=A0A8B6YL62_CAMFR|nr:olfactory receptor 5AS1 [Camelus ferus]XP_010968468.1 olfactory receptor 5AS1 [Camelus bactrianus]XP_010979573.1 olfactory receptor 5AS1 [Camelus dromedarius]
MLESNYTMPIEFLLVGFTDYLPLRVTLFLVFLIVYTLTVMGNIGLIILVNIDSSLQTPMYYFLSNLSFLDFSYSTAITPKMLVDFLASKKSISPYGCALQMFFFGCFADAECLLLAAMAFDRYAAICNPLLYSTLMSRRVCLCCVVLVYVSGSMTSMVHVCLTFRMPFCGSNIINHFFCDIPPLLALSCADTHINELLLFTLCGFIQTSTFVVIFLSYFWILITVLGIKSSGGRSKTFSTCASHLIAVTLFYGTLLFMYLRPTTSYSLGTDKVVAVFYTVVFPMVNPIIYSFRNKDVKNALKKLLDRNRTFS